MPTEISPDEIARILDAIHKLDCAEVEVAVGDVRIVVRRDHAGGTRDAAALSARPAAPGGWAVRACTASAAAADAVQARTAHPPGAAAARAPQDAQPSGASPQASMPTELAAWLEREAQGQAYVMRAPMIGTFYRAKAPGEPPFVEVDAAVRKGDTVGLVEAMKLFNSMVAEFDGKVGAIFVANGEMVEYEQPVLAAWKS
jgi:acetyl-CoA carboxylase biotin carboxyl carrier protein